MIQNLHRVIQLIENNWLGSHVLIIGDLMLDRYIWGDVERISPEAPVPVVRASRRSEQPGGAANVAMNIIALGAAATLFGFIGDDSDGQVLVHSLQQAGIKAETVPVADHPTTSKLRILGGSQQMLRLDTEKIGHFPAKAYANLIARLESAVEVADAIILSDYAKGVLNEEVCQRAIQMARQRRIPVLVDPKQRDFSRYRGATTVCPNLSELSVATGISGHNIDEILAAGQAMVSHFDLECLIATMSEKGIALLREHAMLVAPATARQVFDVSGAGDTVIATLALGMAQGLEMEVSVQLANIAASIVVSKVGTVPVTRNELLISLMPEIELHAKEKILAFDDLLAWVSAWRSARQRIVFTNGCFDLLHIGHITLLEDARREGDKLIVAINSDISVSRLKGPSRPIVGESERARVLAALAAVDAVIVFDDPTPLRLIETLRPDVIVKGGDYSEDTVVGAEEVRSWGGSVKIVPTVDGFSTSKLIAKTMILNTHESSHSSAHD
jgi:D-beta-D-heptose 7-phosphate kinase / D-beta-D-heptose 1-phosphate adenosyltransferase